MDPSSFMDSITGVVVVAMIFAVPILATIATMVIVLAAISRSHRERMKMIEQGMMPAPPKKRTGNYYGLLIAGAIILAFGLALLVAALASRSGDLEGGLIFGFVGLAMLGSFIFIRASRKKEQPPTSNDQPFPPTS
jgi:hypothetical protein